MKLVRFSSPKGSFPLAFSLLQKFSNVLKSKLSDCKIAIKLFNFSCLGLSLNWKFTLEGIPNFPLLCISILYIFSLVL